MTPFIGVMLAIMAVIVATSTPSTVAVRLDQPPMDGWRGPASLAVSIESPDLLFVDGRRTSFASLDASVTRAMKPDTSGIIILADKDLSYGDFMRVVSRLKSHGYAIRMANEDFD